MKKAQIAILAAVVIIVTMLPSSASAGAPVTDFPILDAGNLRLRIPPSWRVESHAVPGLPPTITLTPASGDAFRVILTPLPNLAGPTDPAEVRRTVEQTGKALLSTAVEDTLQIEQIEGQEGTGYFYSLTDRAFSGQPGDFRHMTQGGMVVGELYLSVTVLAQTPESEALRLTMSMLQDSAHIPHD